MPVPTRPAPAEVTGWPVGAVFTTEPSVPPAFFQSHGVYETSSRVSRPASRPLHEQLQVTT